MYEIFSKYGRLLGAVATMGEAEYFLNRWTLASFVIHNSQLVLERSTADE